MGGEFICFLEEESAEEMLRVIIPRLTGISKENIVSVTFEGKRDLRKQLGRVMANYPNYNCVFLVMCDWDDGDCKKLKKELLDRISEHKTKLTKVRIACRELESFYLGDLQAVEKGLDVPNLSKMQNKKPYKMPDNRAEPDKLLEDITNNKYNKTAGSASIAPHLNLDGDNRSKSFNALLQAIKELSRKMPQNAAS